MNTSLLLLGAAGVAAYAAYSKKTTPQSAPKKPAVSGPTPTAANDLLKNVLPAGAQKYLPVGGVAAIGNNQATWSAAAKGVTDLLNTDVAKNYMTGKPGTPATNPADDTSGQWDSVSSTDNQDTGNPLDDNTDVGPSDADTSVPDNAPSYDSLDS